MEGFEPSNIPVKQAALDFLIGGGGEEEQEVRPKPGNDGNWIGEAIGKSSPWPNYSGLWKAKFTQIDALDACHMGG